MKKKERKIGKHNEAVGEEEKEDERVWLGDENYTWSAFRANVVMHWNSLLEGATTVLVIGTAPLVS